MRAADSRNLFGSAPRLIMRAAKKCPLGTETALTAIASKMEPNQKKKSDSKSAFPSDVV